MSAHVSPTGYVAGQAEIVWLSGADRLGFLERMSTARLADLAPGGGRATAVVTDAGRVVDVVACHAAASGAALVTSGPGAAAVVADHLRRYVLFGDEVRITDASAQVDVLRLVGPAARAIAGRVTGIAVDDHQPGAFVQRGEGDAEVWTLCHPSPGGLGGVDVVVPAGAPARAVAERLRGAGAEAWDGRDYALARVRAGWPAFGAEFGAESATQANPLELNLRALVDFAKGCYIGQEVIARLENYERVQRRLVRLHSDAPMAAGDPVRAAAVAAGGRRARPGRVATAVSVPGNGWRALALLPATWSGCREVEVEAVSGRVTATVEVIGDASRSGIGA